MTVEASPAPPDGPPLPALRRRLWTGDRCLPVDRGALHRRRCVNPRFLSDNNINSIFAGNAYIAVAAIGMSMIIIAGHIDVSVGALIGVHRNDCRHLAVSGYPVWVAWTVPIFCSPSSSTASSARWSPTPAFPRLS
jgi:hypothetical protein